MHEQRERVSDEALLAFLVRHFMAEPHSSNEHALDTLWAAGYPSVAQRVWDLAGAARNAAAVADIKRHATSV
jgi:hypothetical protein